VIPRFVGAGDQLKLPTKHTTNTVAFTRDFLLNISTGHGTVPEKDSGVSQWSLSEAIRPLDCQFDLAFTTRTKSKSAVVSPLATTREETVSQYLPQHARTPRCDPQNSNTNSDMTENENSDDYSSFSCSSDSCNDVDADYHSLKRLCLRLSDETGIGIDIGNNQRADILTIRERVARWREHSAFRTCGSGAGETSTSHIHPASSYISTQPLSRAKAKRVADGEDNPNDEDERRRKRQKFNPVDDKLPRLKCPFYQRKPNRPWPNACRGNGWVTMKDLM
jgi:hypothetical protein